MSNYRDLTVWQKARALTVQVYRATRAYPRHEMFGLTAQMRRAGISILCNIAEGQGRWSRPDYLRFLTIARGSALELEAQIVISEDLEYLESADAASLLEATTEVAKMLNGLIRRIRDQIPK